MGRPTFLYDPDCGFCVACVRVLRRHVRPDVDLATPADVDLADWGLTEADARERAWLRATPSELRGGAAAITGVLRRGTRPGRAVGRALDLPGVRVVAETVYRQVAAHRHRLPGGTSACALPQATSAAAARPASRPENRQPPRNVPSSAL